MNTKILSLLVFSIFLFSSVSATIYVNGYFQNNIDQTTATISNGGSITLNAIFTSPSTITSKEIILPTGLSSDAGTCTLLSSGHTYSCTYTITAHSIGTYDIGIMGTDSAGSTHSNSDTLTLIVTPIIPPANVPPVITSSPVTSVNENSAYSYQVTATDANGDTLTYSLVYAPSWLSINSATGLITGTAPLVSVNTNYVIIVGVSDSVNPTTTQTYTLTVLNVANPPTNHAPDITSSPVRSVTEKFEYDYQVVAEDSDGDILTYSLLSAPSWLSINSNTGFVFGTAPSVNSNTQYTVTIQVSDGTATDTQSYTLTVRDSSSITGGAVRYVSDNSNQNKQPSQPAIKPIVPTSPTSTNSTRANFLLISIMIGLILMIVLVMIFIIMILNEEKPQEKKFNETYY